MAVEIRTVGKEQGEAPSGRAAPRGFSRLAAYATGKEILIVGPSSAGKTKFSQYLILGSLDAEGTREMTYQITKSPVFVIRIGAHGDLTLKVRRAVDTPGQVGPIQHASLVGRRKPHGIIVMLDSTKAVSTSVRWLRLFCDRLDTVLRKGSYGRTKLNGFLVVLNKRDKVNNAESDELREGVQEVLGRYLSVVFGADRVGSIPILECISVQTKRGSALIDEAINQLAAQLAR